MLLGVLSTTFAVLAGWAALFAFRVMLSRLFRRKSATEATGNRCRCGYPLENLAVPRCPECGRVAGFDVTAEALGLSIEELEHAQATRERRARDASG